MAVLGTPALCATQKVLLWHHSQACMGWDLSGSFVRTTLAREFFFSPKVSVLMMFWLPRPKINTLFSHGVALLPIDSKPGQNVYTAVKSSALQRHARAVND